MTLLFHSGDEPLVILDTLEDWRFAKNVCPMPALERPSPLRFGHRCVEVIERVLSFQPLVTGGPNIRFYAGAPLKTSDGYNIGTYV